MKYILLLLLVTSTMTLHAQGAYLLELTFDGCIAEDVGASALDATIEGDPTCTCAPGSDAFVLDATQDAYIYQDTTLELQQAWTLSFVFRPDDPTGQQRMFAYKTSCTDQQGVEVTYQGARNSLLIDVFASLAARLQVEVPLDPRRCWHAVSIAKTGSTIITYLYGEEVNRTTSPSIIEVGDAGRLSIGTGPCVPDFASKFVGAFDYISLYNLVLPEEDIRSLTYDADRIVTPNSVIFQGESVTPEVDAPCATDFLWRPSAGVSNPNIAEPTLTPEEPIVVYYLDITDGGCQVEDSIRILVVDPDDVDCDELVLPSAFTPNGDQLNDTYFISNGFAVEELIRFEIFDRWGGRVFSTTTLDQTWDGRHEGEAVMAGVYMYKIEFVCNGEEKLQTGSFSVLN